MDKYLKMFEPAMKKWLSEHYSPEEAKARWERTAALDEKWIREEGDLVPESFRMGYSSYDKENGVIRYSFTQCPNVEFAKRHHMEDVLHRRMLRLLYRRRSESDGECV